MWYIIGLTYRLWRLKHYSSRKMERYVSGDMENTKIWALCDVPNFVVLPRGFVGVSYCRLRKPTLMRRALTQEHARKYAVVP